ncbi:hypothetical protein DFH28DRAFT_1135059 [Melampsora americana]|nr:hypothetical protein DFH28DRAFT_1135059 [Melampsora americana]
MVYPQPVLHPSHCQSLNHHSHPLTKFHGSPKSLLSNCSIESFDDLYHSQFKSPHSLTHSFASPSPSSPSSSFSFNSSSLPCKSKLISTTLPRRPPPSQPKFVLPNLPNSNHTSRSTLPFPSASYPKIKIHHQTSLVHQSSTDSITTTPTSNRFPTTPSTLRSLSSSETTSPSLNSISSSIDPSDSSSTSPSSSSYFPHLSLKVIKRKASKLSLSQSFSDFNKSSSDFNKSSSETSFFSDSSSSSDDDNDSDTALIDLQQDQSILNRNSNSNSTLTSNSNTNSWWWGKVNKYRKDSIDSFIKSPSKKQIKKSNHHSNSSSSTTTTTTTTTTTNTNNTNTNSTKDDWFLIVNKQKHHPLDQNEVPYWMSYQHEVLDHHILMMYACSNEPFTTFTKPTGYQKVLDLGCGPYGIWCQGVIRTTKNPELEVIGLDICPIQLKKLPTQMKFIQHDFLKGPLPFSDHSFDQVNASFLGSAIPEKKWNEMISEIFRILKPGHHLSISETNYDSSNQLKSILKDHQISPDPISIIPSELSLIGNHLKRSKVLFNEIPTSVFQTPILSTLENQRLLLSTREVSINSSISKIKTQSSKSNLTLTLENSHSTESSESPEFQDQGEIVGLLKERFNWVCEMDLEIKERLEERLKRLKETFEEFLNRSTTPSSSSSSPPTTTTSQKKVGSSEEIERVESMEDQEMDLEIQNKLRKIILSIEIELNLINTRLSNQSPLELELDQNSIQIETFLVKTYRDRPSFYL